jgi:hypothetical protein
MDGRVERTVAVDSKLILARKLGAIVAEKDQRRIEDVVMRGDSMNCTRLTVLLSSCNYLSSYRLTFLPCHGLITSHCPLWGIIASAGIAATGIEFGDRSRPFGSSPRSSANQALNIRTSLAKPQIRGSCVLHPLELKWLRHVVQDIKAQDFPDQVSVLRPACLIWQAAHRIQVDSALSARLPDQICAPTTQWRICCAFGLLTVRLHRHY